VKKDLLILSSKKYPEETSLYDVEKVENIINFYYSKLKTTNLHPGKLVYSLIDDGGKFIFKDHLTKTEVELDYCQAYALRAMLKIEDTQGTMFELLERK
jgi:hypothetical protein